MLLRNTSSGSSRQGVVLLAVLIVIVVLSLAAYKYNDFTLAEYRAVDSSLKSAQARAFADSGVHYAAAMLLDVTDNLGGNPWNNPSLFQNITVPTTDKGGKPGAFTVLSVLSPDDLANGGSPAYRFGVTDEAGKINLNGLLALDKGQGNVGYNLLMALPNMTEDVANSILDWLDADETARESGAESDYYSGLSPAYQCKNGPLDSLEELLLVKGVTAQLLFGNDRNRNGVLDPDEDDGSGQVDQGWSAYLTVYSREPNVDSSGNGRIYINDPDLQTLQTTLSNSLSTPLTNFILAYRLYGGSSTGGSGAGGSGGAGGAGGGSSGGSTASGSDQAAVGQVIQNALANSSTSQKLNNISSLWSLVNSTVTVSVPNGRMTRKVKVPSPLNDPGTQAQYLPILLDTCTTSTQADLTPRINVNTAPQTVLTALTQVVTQLQTTDVQNIVSMRPQMSSGTPPDPSFNTPAWLLTQANLSASTLQKLDPYITARSGVYRFQALGYFEKDGPVSRVEAVVDTYAKRPRIVYLRDITELGKGFDMSTIRSSSSGPGN
jgi:hypothetical protein